MGVQNLYYYNDVKLYTSELFRQLLPKIKFFFIIHKLNYEQISIFNPKLTQETMAIQKEYQEILIKNLQTTI